MSDPTPVNSEDRDGNQNKCENQSNPFLDKIREC